MGTGLVASDKSATQAGFFALGQDRLIEPIVGAQGQTERSRAPAGDDIVARIIGTTEAEEAEQSMPKVDPLVRGLLDHLPAPGQKWPHDKRQRWLQTLAANLDFVYPPDETDKFIAIESKPI